MNKALILLANVKLKTQMKSQIMKFYFRKLK